MQFPDLDCSTDNDVNNLSEADQPCQSAVKNKLPTCKPFPLSYQTVLDTRQPDLLRKDRLNNGVYTHYIKSPTSHLVADAATIHTNTITKGTDENTVSSPIKVAEVPEIDTAPTILNLSPDDTDLIERELEADWTTVHSVSNIRTPPSPKMQHHLEQIQEAHPIQRKRSWITQTHTPLGVTEYHRIGHHQQRRLSVDLQDSNCAI